MKREAGFSIGRVLGAREMGIERGKSERGSEKERVYERDGNGMGIDA